MSLSIGSTDSGGVRIQFDKQMFPNLPNGRLHGVEEEIQLLIFREAVKKNNLIWSCHPKNGALWSFNYADATNIIVTINSAPHFGDSTMSFDIKWELMTAIVNAFRKCSPEKDFEFHCDLTPSSFTQLPDPH